MSPGLMFQRLHRDVMSWCLSVLKGDSIHNPSVLPMSLKQQSVLSVHWIHRPLAVLSGI